MTGSGLVEIPYGYCHCGCGQKTNIAERSYKSAGLVKGEPYRFISGHNVRRNLDGAYGVDPTTGCWVWLRTSDGRYGTLTCGGRKVKAHRFFYEREHGPIPDGLTLDHLCRNTLCVNPAHLEPVTHAENMRRGAVTRLTAEQAAEIRSSTESALEIAARFGVTRDTVYDIRLGRTWRT